jgi:hypothetical protein
MQRPLRFFFLVCSYILAKIASGSRLRKLRDAPEKRARTGVKIFTQEISEIPFLIDRSFACYLLLCAAHARALRLTNDCCGLSADTRARQELRKPFRGLVDVLNIPSQRSPFELDKFRSSLNIKSNKINDLGKYCKSVYTGSIPVLASIYFQALASFLQLHGLRRLQGRLQFCSCCTPFALANFTKTESVSSGETRA